ncbi:hypothetical protein J6590_084549 [Homalodisca vitripennis]|nr:hypothetical protein J6590_084549 [Homalodisca vitripennis]
MSRYGSQQVINPFGWDDTFFYSWFKNSSWPYGVIFYDLDPHLTPHMLHAINHVIKYLNSLDTCVQWLQRNPYSFDDNVQSWISFVHYKDSPNATVCSSLLNRINGQQFIKIGTYCAAERLPAPLDLENTLLHEMGHAMGLLHEHQRPDRDCYVYISPFLLNAKRKNFRRIPGKRFPSGFPYDVDSIMHYVPANLRLFHYHADSIRKLGRVDATLSVLDIHKLNHLYCGRRSYCEEHNSCNGFYNFAVQQPLCFRQGPTYTKRPEGPNPVFTEDVSLYEEM